MYLPEYLNPKKTIQLYGLVKYFNFLKSLFLKKKLPKVLMLSGSKGSGKSTLINHFLFSIFDEKNYNTDNLSLHKSSHFLNQFNNDIFQNIIYIHGSDFKSLKINDIRILKSIINKTSIINKERFIIFDDIELFNINSLNALLKIIEEPSKNNYFILINNKTKPLLDTIKSRSLDVKIILSENRRIEIINELIKLHKIKNVLDPKQSRLTPGNFLKFNYIFDEFNITINDNFLENLSLLLDLHKKNKNNMFIDIAFYLSDFYFNNLKDKNIIKRHKIYEFKSFVSDNLNKYLTFSLNHNSLINAINNKLNHG